MPAAVNGCRSSLPPPPGRRRQSPRPQSSRIVLYADTTLRQVVSAYEEQPVVVSLVDGVAATDDETLVLHLCRKEDDPGREMPAGSRLQLLQINDNLEEQHALPYPDFVPVIPVEGELEVLRAIGTNVLQDNFAGDSLDIQPKPSLGTASIPEVDESSSTSSSTDDCPLVFSGYWGDGQIRM